MTGKDLLEQSPEDDSSENKEGGAERYARKRPPEPNHPFPHSPNIL